VAGFGKHCALIEPNTGARVLRSEADGRDGCDAVLAHLPNGARDIWLPIAHADVYRQSNMPLKQTRLCQGDVRQRAFANEAIAMRDLVDG
jgi:hypothetical protein